MDLKEIAAKLCYGYPVHGDGITDDLASAINDDLQNGETALLSNTEVALYLEAHREEGLHVLDELARLDLGVEMCRPRAPLFDNGVKLKILRLANAGLREGAPVDFDAVFGGRYWSESPAGTAIPELVSAIVNIVSFGSAVDALANKLNKDQGHSFIQGRIYYQSNLFVPPESVVPGELRPTVKKIWETVSEIIMQEVWKKVFDLKSGRSFNDSEFVKELGREFPFMRSRLITSVGQDVFLYVDVDVARAGKTPDEIEADMTALYRKVQERVKSEVEAVLKDKKKMDEIFSAADLDHTLDIGLGLEKMVAYYDAVRARIEDPEEKQKFVNNLDSAIKTLAEKESDIFGDLHTELLSSNDYAMGYVGLYIPSADGGRSSIVRVPMSNYCSGTLMEWNKVMEIFAHELAHHKVRKLRERSGTQGGSLRPHDLSHTVIAEEIRREIDKMKLSDG